MEFSCEIRVGGNGNHWQQKCCAAQDNMTVIRHFLTLHRLVSCGWCHLGTPICNQVKPLQNWGNVESQSDAAKHIAQYNAEGIYVCLRR